MKEYEDINNYKAYPQNFWQINNTLRNWHILNFELKDMYFGILYHVKIDFTLDFN